MPKTATAQLFTSESVCAGHPDKICDAISDAIVDSVLSQDPQGKVGVETLVTKNRVVIAGEVKARAAVDCEAIARSEIKRLGYTQAAWGFGNQGEVQVYIHAQSPEIAKGVEKDGAGDQGMMFGYACNETPELMPLPITLAHALTRRIDQVREKGILPGLRPDGKAQVTLKYSHSKTISAEKIVLAVPHTETMDLNELRTRLYEKVVAPVLKNHHLQLATEDLIVNGTGVWHMPGPAVDTGLTGRKIVVDSYGGYARVGGGCFSGKDPTKVDRSGAYAARFIAKNIVAAGLADKAEVSLAYFIGAQKPIMREITTYGTNTVSNAEISRYATDLIDTSVAGIIKRLKLNRPIYHQTAAYGHFGRANFPWEEVVTYR